ncbi:hypothetical protein G6F70_003461 [Rhizopus microsporus]|nr:hypothetical protein G6F71_003416 [Rhizopus microsporus]KAG1201084.1 hypothetical protein G6F70_003461 [Rhizopus microsporus]KAG1213047.1 hypothetical protein G6F69_003149 [Rhizopus microsporus]KAG1235098.1 hypothetical protein G6F67_003011 [Rhizopus microsporus]
MANTCKYSKFVNLIEEVVDHITQLVYAGSIFANYYFLELLENGEELPVVSQNLFYNIFSIFAVQGKPSPLQKTFKRLTVLPGFNVLSITAVHSLTPR